MLVSLGAGPAASRLPALESEMRAANSYLTLLQKVRPMYEEMGGSTNYVALEEAIYAVGQFPYGVEVEVPPVLKSVPETVRNRTQALTHLSAVLQANTDTVAHAYGFYTALSDQNQMLATGASTDTLKTSFSLKKLRTQSYAAYIAGQQTYGDYNSFKTRKRQAREIVPST